MSSVANSFFSKPKYVSLTPEESVGDDTLREFARLDPQRISGAFSQEDQAALGMYLADICGELLARRAMMR